MSFNINQRMKSELKKFTGGATAEIFLKGDVLRIMVIGLEGEMLLIDWEHVAVSEIIT